MTEQIDFIGGGGKLMPGPRPKKIGTPAPPGTGPEGETCKTCAHRCRVRIRSGRVFQKCAKIEKNWTHGSGTDIKLRWPACSFWEPEPVDSPTALTERQE